MKEIIYQANRMVQIVEEDKYKGVKYAILNLGTHPTAYVQDILEVNDYDDKILDEVDVHGGFTYCDTPHWEESDDIYLGWDYAHCGDYMGYYASGSMTALGDKHWTYEEILAEVHSVIDQLLNIKESK